MRTEKTIIVWKSYLYAFLKALALIAFIKAVSLVFNLYYPLGQVWINRLGVAGIFCEARGFKIRFFLQIKGFMGYYILCALSIF